MRTITQTNNNSVKQKRKNLKWFGNKGRDELVKLITLHQSYLDRNNPLIINLMKPFSELV